MKSYRQDTKLYIVPTPIGNLGDMTFRAVEVLRHVDYIASEDTRVTHKLLNAFDIKDKKVIRLDENIMRTKAPDLIEKMKQGKTFAFCSDAGMPGVSDPGRYLVRLAHQAEVKTEILPGASAVTTAYVASGTSSPSFFFGGFVPRKDKGRKELLSSLASLDACLIFYESPHRLCATLKMVEEVMPRRRVTVCRELTKIHEEVLFGTARELLGDFFSRDHVKGEIVLVVDPATSEDHKEAFDDIERRIGELLDEGLSHKSITKALTEEFHVSRNDVYALVLKRNN